MYVAQYSKGKSYLSGRYYLQDWHCKHFAWQGISREKLAFILPNPLSSANLLSTDVARPNVRHGLLCQ